MVYFELLPIILTWLSGIAFICYGSLSLFTGGMDEEFKRYGLSRFRKLVGLLEVLGGLGSLIGLIYNPLLMLSSAGLACLMLLGVIVRLRLKDSFFLIIPASSLMLINAFILKVSIASS